MKDPLKQHIYEALDKVAELTGLQEEWYIAQDQNGEWWTHSEEPEFDGSNTYWVNANALCFQVRTEDMPKFEDWTETCVRVGDIFE